MKNKSCTSKPNGVIKNGKICKTKKKSLIKYEDLKKPLKKFNGLSLEEVMKMKLSDRLKEDLDILFIGINPSPLAAFKNHHYVGNNHMWSCLRLSGLVDEGTTAENDVILPDKYQIGFTTMVNRSTKCQNDLNQEEFLEGGKNLLVKIQKFKPKISVFNGKKIYEIFLKKVLKIKKLKVEFGKQEIIIPGCDTKIYMMPSTSALCATYPTANHKLPFFKEIKLLKEELNK